MLSYDQSQFDTAAGYLYSVGLTEDPPVHATAPLGLQVSVFPMDAEELALTGHYWAALSLRAPHPSSVKYSGVRYLAFAMFSGVAFKLNNLIRRKRSNRRRRDGIDQLGDEPMSAVRIRGGQMISKVTAKFDEFRDAEHKLDWLRQDWKWRLFRYRQRKQIPLNLAFDRRHNVETATEITLDEVRGFRRRREPRKWHLSMHYRGDVPQDRRVIESRSDRIHIPGHRFG